MVEGLRCTQNSSLTTSRSGTTPEPPGGCRSHRSDPGTAFLCSSEQMGTVQARSLHFDGWDMCQSEVVMVEDASDSRLRMRVGWQQHQLKSHFCSWQQTGSAERQWEATRGEREATRRDSEINLAVSMLTGFDML